MALILNSIGSFVFLVMTPVPPKRRRRMTVESRPGVEGVALWWDGARGEIWRPHTKADSPSFAAAIALKALYEDACGVGTVAVVYADTTFPAVVIKDVHVEIRDVVHGIGGLNPNPRAMIEAQWEIVIL